MSKKNAAPSTPASTPSADEAVLTDVVVQSEVARDVFPQEQPTTSDNSALISAAVEAGLATIALGKPKIDAAMEIFQQLESLPQEEVVKAFIDGANLTSKGALSRRARRLQFPSSSRSAGSLLLKGARSALRRR